MHANTRIEPSSQSQVFLWIWAATLIVLPLMVWPSHETIGSVDSSTVALSSATGLIVYNPETSWLLPKVLFLALISSIGILYIKDNWRGSLLEWLVAAYLLLATLSAFFSGDTFQYIFLGGNNRLDGLLYQYSVVSYMLVWYYLVLRIKERAFRFLIAALAIVGLVESAIVMAQRLGYDPVGYIVRMHSYTDYTVGTIGHPGMVAGLLLPIAVVSYVIFLYRRSYFYLFVALITAGAISLTYNKSSAYALIFTALLVPALNPRKIYRTALWATPLLIMAVLGTAHVVPNHMLEERSLTNMHTGKTRLLIWKLAADVALHTPGQPLIGAGPDGFKLQIIKQKRLDELIDTYRLEYRWNEKVTKVELLGDEETPLKDRAIHVSFAGRPIGRFFHVSLDRAHDLLLDRTIQAGLLAALITLYIYLVPILALLKHRDKYTMAFGAASFALVLYYVFWFPVPQVEPIHAAILAAAWAHLHEVHSLYTNETLAPTS